MTKSYLAQMLCQLTYGGQLEYSGTNDCFLWGGGEGQTTRKTNSGGEGQMIRKTNSGGGGDDKAFDRCAVQQTNRSRSFFFSQLFSCKYFSLGGIGWS